MGRASTTLTDDINFFADCRDLPTSIVSVTSTATSTQTGADQNQTGPGACFWLNITSVQATCTVRLNIQGKDPVSLNYVTLASLSVDGISVTNTGQISILQVGPAAATNPSGNGGSTAAQSVQLYLPRVLRAQVSITATASVGGAGLSFTVGMTRLTTL